MARSFDTRAKTSELIPETVVVEGTTFKVKRTGKALKRIIEMNPEEDLVNLSGVDGISRIYQSLAVLLVDEEGNHPDPEKLEDEIDMEVANILMETFMPGNPPAPEMAPQSLSPDSGGAS